MDEIPLSTGALWALLIILLLLSAFFSGSETGLMSLNRYRLRHLVRSGNRAARLTERLLSRPDRLIGLILLGNNLVNIFASVVATVLALRIGGEGALAVAPIILTFAVLIFSEVTPKTLAALKPERVALPASYVYLPLLKALYPVVWLVNMIANGLLRLLGVSADNVAENPLSREELRTVVLEAGAMIPKRHQHMLVNILDLDKATVEDIMIPRPEITGLDLSEDWEDVVYQLQNSQHTRLPLYDETIDNILGMVHLRRVLPLAARNELTRDTLLEVASDPYFIPEGTPLNKQLMNFQGMRERIGLVVDEYGDITGLATLEDILEEIVGEFTTDPAQLHRDIQAQDDGSYLVAGSTSVRTLNRILHMGLPTDGPKTLNGIILEQLDAIPQSGGVSFKLNEHEIEVVQTGAHSVRTARVRAIGAPPQT